MEQVTTIQLSVETKNKLEALKMSERDTFNDVIRDLLEDSMEVSEETKKEIKEALKDIKEGRTHTHEEVKKKLGL